MLNYAMKLGKRSNIAQAVHALRSIAGVTAHAEQVSTEATHDDPPIT